MSAQNPVLGAALNRFSHLPKTRLHYSVIAACMFALAFDLGEIALGSALSAIFSSGPDKVSSSELGWLLASVYLGGAVGAWPLGYLADRFGRRNLIVVMLWMLAITSVLAGLSENVRTLAIFRGLSGLAMGCLPVVLIAYLTDLLPVRGRAGAIMAMSAFGFAGGPLLLLLLNRLESVTSIGDDAWRWALAAGGVGAVICAIVFRWLPESPLWLAARGRDQEALLVMTRFESPLSRDTSGVAGRPAKGRQPKTPAYAEDYSLRLILICAICALTPAVTISFPVLSGALLVERGFRLTDSIFYVAYASFGYPIGALLSSFVLDRMERVTSLTVTAGGLAAGLAIFFLGATPVVIMSGAGLFLAFAAIFTAGLNIYAAELFPLRVRATTTSAAWGVLRLSAVACLLLLVPILRNQGPSAVFMLMLSALALISILLVSFGPRSEAKVNIEQKSD